MRRAIRTLKQFTTCSTGLNATASSAWHHYSTEQMLINDLGMNSNFASRQPNPVDPR